MSFGAWPSLLSVVAPAVACALYMSLAPGTSQLSLTTLALTSSVLPALMLGKLFAPVRYYLRLTSFLLGLGQSFVSAQCALRPGWGRRPCRDPNSESS